MSAKQILNRVIKSTSDNSPTILTAAGVLGLGLTAYLSVKATFKASLIIEEIDVYTEPLTAREKFEKIWKLYIPAAGVGVMTAACIIGANRIGTRRAAAVASAFALSERAFDEYRSKVVERIGEKKEEKIRDEIAQDRITGNAAMNALVVGDGKVPCWDNYTGRPFASTMEEIKKAQNDTNYLILNQNYASLNDFFDRVGLPRTKMGEDVGWSLDTGQLEIKFGTTMTDDQRPAISIDFSVTPIRKFWKANP